jgi:glutathione-regulated potassium-efflux system ancillary protein KefG
MSVVSNRILILFAHPALHRSRVNKRLVEAAAEVGGVTVHDLYEAYPDFHIDVPREQALAAGHEVLIFQHPMYWYSTPALVKQWIDLVLQYNWAFGPKGSALRGKRTLSVVTTGGNPASYGPGTMNRYSVRDFLRPVEQTMALCRMEYLPPFVVQGTHALTAERIEAHVRAYRLLLAGLRDGTLPLAGTGPLESINEVLAPHA